MPEDSEYALPNNDEAEHQRLERQDDSLEGLMNGRVIHAPLSQSVSRLIDFGCGTGRITTILGREYPKATVYGIDLSPVPAIHEKPDNVEYIQGDLFELAGKDPRLQENSTDFIFSRLLICGMDNWQGYLDTVAKLLKSGGWVETQELDLMFYDKDGQRIDQDWEWLKAIRAAGEQKKFDMDSGSHAADYMRNARLVDIQVHEYPWLFDKSVPAARELVKMGPGVYDHLISTMLEGKGYTDEDIERFRAQMKENLKSEEGKHLKFKATIGRKP